MAKYLINVVETYRVDNEEEAAALIQEAKTNSGYVLKKYSSIQKERRQKGEVVDSWFRVSLTKEFTDEKEPEDEVSINYVKGAF